MSAKVTQLETVTLACDTEGCGNMRESTGKYRDSLFAEMDELGWRAFVRSNLSGSTFGPIRYACPECSEGALR